MSFVITLILGAICVLMMLIGLVGSVVPAVPGAPLIFLGALILAMLNNFQRISVTTILWLAGVTIISYFINLFFIARGVRKNSTGSTGMLFAAIGALLGLLILNFVGFFLGLIFGFIVGELFSGTLPGRIPKLAIGVLGSFMVGAIFQFFVALLMLVIVLVAYFFN